MPYCKNCHREISRFDSDICPYCGTRNPIDENYKTQDVTQHIDPVKGEYKLYRSKSRKTYGLLCTLLGYFGIHEFYLGFAKKAVWELVITLLLVGGVGSLLYFLAWKNWMIYLFLFLAVWIFYAVLGLLYAKKDTLKDAKGEFLR